MDYKMLKAYDYLQDIVYLTDLETLEVLWMNQAGQRVFGALKPKTKCYEMFYAYSEPCQNCRKNDILTHFSEYASGRRQCCNRRVIHGIEYRSKKTAVELEGKHCALDIIYDVDDIMTSYHKNDAAKRVYEVLLSKMSEVDIKGNMTEQIEHILRIMKEMFQSSWVSMVKSSPEDDFPTISIRDEDFPEFFYNPVMREVLQEDTEYARWLQGDTFLFVDAEEIQPKYPHIRRAMLEAGDENFMLMTWNIDGFSYYLVLENVKIKIEDKKVFRLIYNFLYFTIRSFLYNKTLYRLSNLDGLTALYNRNKYNADLASSFVNTHENVGVIYLDLDNLKSVNDSFGHLIGNKLIIATAKILRECFPGGNVYRVGGDEFIIIIPDTTYEELTRQVDAMNQRMAGGKIFCSYGMEYQKDNATISEMVANAEREMYVYKRRHHDKYSYEIERDAVVCKLKEALSSNQFYLVLQPKINPYSNQIVGAEALIRGKKEGQWQYPNEFIPLFEKNNCIDLIDYFMLEEAARLQRSLLDSYHKSYPISVNVARTTLLMPSFEQDMMALLKKYDIPQNLIHLEVTERMDLSSEDILAHGQRLKRYGVQLEVDDFGTHFTNLGFLRKDVFSVVKIDRSIFKKLKVDSLTAKLIQLVIEECHQRNVIVLAEGVETEEDLEQIKAMYIDEVQGYYYDKPMKPELFIAKYLKREDA